MIKTRIETLSPWREFYHRFHTSGHLSHETVEEQEVRTGESQGTSVLERLPPAEELRHQQLLHSTAVACWLALVMQRGVWVPALSPGIFRVFHTAQSSLI